MVSECFHPSYYAAVVTGGAGQEEDTTPPPTQSPIHTTLSTIPQENHIPQVQRSYGAEDVENPYLFSTSDSKNLILVSPPLVGSSNYGSWCISMRIALEVKNKWWIIDSSVAAPNREDNRYGPWRRCNLMLCSWIFRSVHPSIAQSVMRLESSRDVWNDLKRRFAQCDAQRISGLQNDIYSLKQGSQSISDYYTKCRTMWEEMNTLRPLPLCICDPRCRCDLIDEIRKEREVD
ncbi:PREDICTED: uncharacterized protein LOC109155071 [Ipomoea nil]|uniref:uncharacterized protein LOC109155071 n=1 Tax=Ipomoea nil TaxID=35883 RepID=UPI000901F9E3|nr:PREDICTED: uncharacterized protein LOC109155071 [Ipomoea nil]